MMGIFDVGRLSLGQWVAICQQWQMAHGGGGVSAPSEEEFEEAIVASRTYGN